jgi:hypothetical protein
MFKQKVDPILSKFEPISLIELEQAKLLDRFDTKFIMSTEQFLKILGCLVEDYKMLEINGVRCFSYESRYFDDDNFTFFRDHHSGKINRYKIRLRNYVESGRVYLEIKERKKGRTNKKRMEIDSFRHELNDKDREFIVETSGIKEDLKAVLDNSYKRITLMRKDGSERLTFDFDLSYFHDGKDFPYEGIVIAELKQAKVNRNSPFFQLMKRSLIRPLRISKYCLGIIAVYGNSGPKFNRFKSKLLKLNYIRNHAA